MALFECNFSNGEQEKLPDLDSKSAPPLTDFKDGNSKSEKLPTTTTAPPTVFNFGNPLIDFKAVLLAMTKPPPTEVKLVHCKVVKSLFELTVKV